MVRLYTLQEEIANSLTHGIGSLVVAVLFGILACATFGVAGVPITAKAVGCCIFGISSMLMLIISSLYHAITHIPTKRILKMCDHIAIYFLIAGTYIPLTLAVILPVSPAIAWSFLAIQILCVVGGVIFKLTSNNNYGMISVVFYCIIGWSVILILKPLIVAMPVVALYWLIAGGLAYTAGVPFYVLKQYKWTHSIWHVFVLIGLICHYMMMFMI